MATAVQEWMVMKMRLIDADALIDELGISDEDIIFEGMLVDAPTIDAVPVIRCKDCKCWTEWSNGTGSCSRFALDWIGTDADDFCSMGERKDDES